MPFAAERRHIPQRRTLLVAAALQLACSTAQRPQATLLNTPVTHSSEPALPVWNRFDQLRSWPSVSETPWKVSGHAPKPYIASVRVSPEARAQYLSLVSDSVLPSSSVVAELVLGPDERVQQILAMEKQTNGRWEFLVATATGRVSARGSALAPCARCHADAPADSLFGPPRQTASDSPPVPAKPAHPKPR